MRDLLILVILPLLVYATLSRPAIGLGLWLWSSAFNINQLVYGIASSITYSKLFAGLTIISFLLCNKKSKIHIEKITIFIILFFFIATLSNFFAIGDMDYAWERWTLYFKVVIFYIFAIAIINKKIHFDFIIWILILSIGSMAATEGLKFIVSGGGYKFDSLKGIVGDNNFFGVMIVTIIPLTYYIITQTKHRLIKMGGYGLLFLIVMGVIASYSRGAFLGLIIIGIFSWKSSKRKFLWLFLLLTIISTIVFFMPEEWLSRMNTIESADTDSSFMGRIIAWKLSMLIAMDNFLGGGFKALENLSVWFYYSQYFDKLDFIPTSYPDQIKFHASHSIYFQVLGNHGFLGLFLFLSILFTAYLKLLKLTRLALVNDLEEWIIILSKMLKISLITYCISGAAVNVAYFDFLYAILAMIVALDAKVIKQIQENTSKVDNFRQKF